MLHLTLTASYISAAASISQGLTGRHRFDNRLTHNVPNAQPITGHTADQIELLSTAIRMEILYEVKHIIPSFDAAAETAMNLATKILFAFWLCLLHNRTTE